MNYVHHDKEVEKIEVIRTTLLVRGKGVQGDPVRRITRFWSLDGDLLAEVDRWVETEKVLEEARKHALGAGK